MSASIAASGLNAVNDQLDSISNNIANAGTVGYKSSTTQFSAVYAGSQAMGVTTAGTAQSITRSGSMMSTGNAMDLAISGNGFFITRSPSGDVSYTRAGYFETDLNGKIVDNQGNFVQGYPVDANGNLQTGTVTDLSVSTGNIPAKASSKVDFTANFDASSTVPTVTPFDSANSASYNNTYTSQVYDSLGQQHTLTQYMVKTGDNTWEMHYGMDGKNLDQTTTLTFDTNGALVATPPTVLTVPVPGAADLSISLDYSSCTQYGSEFSVTANNADGYASAERTGVAIDDDGGVYATYSNGERMLQGQIVLANFANPNGLVAQDGTSWTASSESGAAVIGTPGTGMYGSLDSGMLESSNVDITSELVELMGAQRNYQADTKVIATDDELMQSLFQSI
ncbi:MAG: flagellar hook protein FlgE [Ewingella sp.]|uniref:flagellar hook protein FlgE n=1 Tax=Ewingella TaxID=41201 RepID=UPI0033658026